MFQTVSRVDCPGGLRRGARQLASQMNNHHVLRLVAPGHTEPGLQAGWHFSFLQNFWVAECMSQYDSFRAFIQCLKVSIVKEFT